MSFMNLNVTTHTHTRNTNEHILETMEKTNTLTVLCWTIVYTHAVYLCLWLTWHNYWQTVDLDRGGAHKQASLSFASEQQRGAWTL